MTLVGGAAGAASGPPCVDGTPGLDFAGSVTVVAGTAHSLDVTTPVRMGSPATNVLVGEPGELPILAIALQPNALYFPAWLGVVLVGSPFVPVTLAAIPPGGVLTFDVVVPIVPGTQSLQVFEQVAFVDIAAAVVTLSSPAFPLLLDPSL